MRFAFSPILLPVAYIAQQASGECLAACAAMVFTYLGIPVNYQRLVRVLRVQRPYGTPFFHVRELSRLGVTVTYRQGTLTDLHTNLVQNSPCIAGVKTGQLPYWNNVDTPHAVVVVGMDSEHIYLNDPAHTHSPVQVHLGDFDLAWLEQDEHYVVLTG